MQVHVITTQMIQAAEQDTDDGSCEYPAEGFDCAGNCISGDLITFAFI